MNTNTKRATSVGISLGAIGAVVIGSIAFASNVDRAPVPEPTPMVATYTPTPEPVAPTVNGLAAEQEAEAAEVVRLAAEAEAARVAAEAEAARVAAEQEAQRVAEEQAAQNAGENTDNRAAQNAPETAQPEPAPAPPAPLKTCPAGTEPIEFDGAGNALGCMDPSCFSGTVEPGDPRCAVVRP